MNESRAAAAYLVNKYGKDDSLYPKVTNLIYGKTELNWAGNSCIVDIKIKAWSWLNVNLQINLILIW